MADLFLNFKDFHHEKTDDKSTTLRHKKLGHSITLAHNVLSPKNKQALMDMAKSAKKSETSDQASEAEDQDSGYGKVIKMADGGVGTEKKQDYVVPAEQRDGRPTPPPRDKTQKETLHDVGNAAGGGGSNSTLSIDPRSWLADGGKVEAKPIAVSADPQYPDAQDTKQPLPVPPPQDLLQTGADQLKENPVADERYSQAVDDAVANTGKFIMSPSGQPIADAPSAPPTPVGDALSNVSSQDPQSQGIAAQPQGASDPMSNAMSATESGMNTGYANQMAGIKGEAKAKGALGQEQAKVYQQGIQAEQEAKDHYQSTYNELEQERQAHMADIQNGYIDPNQYWTGDKNGEGGHSKIAAGIGMILAGFNPTNSPNAAINFLKYQMDRNMDAQKQNLGAKQNLLAANLRQFGNLKDATEMTRLMQGDLIVNELNTAAAKAQNPLAKNAALQAVGQLQREQAVNSQKFAMQRAMINMANNGGSAEATDKMLGYMRLYAPEQAREMEQRYVPGVGMGSVAVPAEARQQIIASKSVNDLMNKSLEFSQQHRGTLKPSELAQASTIQNQLIGTIKQAQHDGVYKPSEATFLLSQIGGSPASFFANLSSVPKIKELQSIKQQEYGRLLQSYGFKPQQLPSSASQPQYKTVNGVKYMRGPNNKAVKVN